MQTTFADYLLDDDPARVDRDVLWGYLSTEAYWGRWRSRDDVERQLASAWLLHTADAHGLYERFGFAPPERRSWNVACPAHPAERGKTWGE